MNKISIKEVNKVKTIFCIWYKWSIIISSFSLLIAIIGLFCSLGGVRVEITHETFIGTIVTLLGIMMTIILGYQIINYVSFEKRINLIIEKKLEEVEEKMTYYKREVCVDIYLGLLRNSLQQNDWNITLTYVIETTDHIIYTKDEQKANFIINFLFECFNQNEINLNKVLKDTIYKLCLSLPQLRAILNDDDIEKLTKILAILNKDKNDTCN